MPSFDRSSTIAHGVSARRLRYAMRRTLLWRLIIYGLLLEACYLLFFEFLVYHTSPTDPLQSAWVQGAPFLIWLYRPAHWISRLAALPFFHAVQGHGYGLLLLLGLLLLIFLLVALQGRPIRLVDLESEDIRSLFWLLTLFSILFGLTMLLAPIALNLLSSDLLLSGLAGRMVVLYHLNPYTFGSLHAVNSDTLFLFLSRVSGALPVSTGITSGPVWTDLCILLTLVTQLDIFKLLLGMRLVGLLTYLISLVVLWVLLLPCRPSQRFVVFVLYAWNPLPLLFGIALGHLELVQILFAMLTLLALRRESTLLGWVFALLAALINLTGLLLLPLFFRILAREIRFQGRVWQMFWWFTTIVVTVLVIGLAYLPFWQGWGVRGILDSLYQTFLPTSSVNSLAEAVMNLPVHLPSWVQWVLVPRHWACVALVIIGLYLLFALWLVDTLDLMLLCATWLAILWLIFQPVYWPWYLLLPFCLALCSLNRNSIACVIILTAGALFCYYLWLRSITWPGQGLLIIGVPFLLWGWVVFFFASWQMLRNIQTGSDDTQSRKSLRLVRPPWRSGSPGTSRSALARRRSI